MGDACHDQIHLSPRAASTLDIAAHCYLRASTAWRGPVHTHADGEVCTVEVALEELRAEYRRLLREALAAREGEPG